MSSKEKLRENKLRIYLNKVSNRYHHIRIQLESESIFPIQPIEFACLDEKLLGIG